GGNTSCLELRFHNSERVIIIDAGSGMRSLGDNMIANNSKNDRLKADVLLTHTHLDHILGLPFFAPIYNSQTILKIYGPVTCEESLLKDVIGGQFSYRYFPVRQNELAASIEYINLKEGQYDLGEGIKLTAKYMNHPLLSLGYRIECCGKIICTAYDTEPFYNVFSSDTADTSQDELLASEGALVAREENQRMVEFFSGADLLIHDGQYTLAEYECGKKGWGHSPIEYVVDAARRASVKRLAICHHDPLRTDSQIDEFSEIYCSKEVSGNMDTFFAREGMQIEIT
ncbi:MAG: MBL fold metallo-hydrolase, partial [Desulfobacterales bacterium]